MKTGAVIVAAGMSSRMGRFKPMLPIGPLTAVQRIIHTFHHAEVSSVVLVTGNQAETLEEHVSGMSVVCVRNEQYASTHMLDSIKIGLRSLEDRCDQVLLTPVDYPLFLPDTVRRLMDEPAHVVIPVHQEKKGHPIMLSRELVAFAQAYDGTGGLSGAIRASAVSRHFVDVDDEGVILDMDVPEDYEALLALYERRNAQMRSGCE